jgi:hypothetical protein
MHRWYEWYKGIIESFISVAKYMISSIQLFIHFHLVIWPFFKKIKQKFSFQISKMKIFKFKNENFQFFHFKFS